MRRLVVPALCAVTIAAPIPVALGQAGPDIANHVAFKLAQRELDKFELRQEAREAKRAASRRAKAKRAPSAPAVAIPPQLEVIAQCESGGDPTAVSSNGMYHGKYQFSVATWTAMGGSGLPSQASEAEQDRRAAMLYARSGPSQWPVCGV